ncbi:MAG TPA: heparinase II/III family protein [Gemmatimonadaceae bacterium]|nr:heparinase II/III family protein [Gemmatimonadaceae bacterium]
MTLLLSSAQLQARRAAAAKSLEPLVTSLRHDLDRVLAEPLEIPTRKALLSRDGGRCPRDASQLVFDPFSPSAHRCGVCGAVYSGERHDRAWITWYQLWLAERAVHAAVLHAVTGHETLAALARTILRQYADQYLDYPNRDNVLGPSRPFFSTYLESIWLLYVAIALDVLELTDAAGTLSSGVRERVLEPSVSLIASYDEGGSNRQVWNNAALAAARLLLDRPSDAEDAIIGESGLFVHLANGLLADGSWYEGENYHFFAHRGLWYGVVFAERAGVEIPSELVRRFDQGFSTPLATALPDFTFPSRRDSQYAISLRQWRFAESCELGYARTGERQLIGALHELYDRPYPRGDTGRWRSTAESERNEAATSLTRADLGWRSLLFAMPSLPPLEAVPARSAHLEDQGFAVFRRDGGRVYAALDYGHSGGGHGHPDRLNVLLSVGRERWLDDMGTGSYVDPTLHWYRSTLAHNAPLFDGRSQRRAHGVLRAYEERGGAGWVDAEVPTDGLAAGVRCRRALIVMTDYAVEELQWESERDVRVELPVHVEAELSGVGEWKAATLDGGGGAEDGFSFVRESAFACAPNSGVVRLSLSGGDGGDAWLISAPDVRWWRAVAPGAPRTGDRAFFIARSMERSGSIASVWSWGKSVAEVEREGDVIRVWRSTGEIHEHRRRGDEWHVELLAGSARSSIVLGGALPQEIHLEASAPNEAHFSPRAIEIPTSSRPLSFHLAADHYRRSEASWHEAGSPEAVLTLGVRDGQLSVEIDVRKRDVYFRPANAPEPALDNEHPDIHSDGVQLYLRPTGQSSMAGWLAVPDRDGDTVRIRSIDGSRADIPITARWSPTPRGYVIRFLVPLSAVGAPSTTPFWLDVIVNDMSSDRERRRGQLVLSGAYGGYVYLQGDRQSPHRLLPFVVSRA